MLIAIIFPVCWDVITSGGICSYGRLFATRDNYTKAYKHTTEEHGFIYPEENVFSDKMVSSLLDSLRRFGKT